MIRFELPFPAVSKLSGNGRLHWTVRSRLAKRARIDGYMLAISGQPRGSVSDWLLQRPLPIRFVEIGGDA